MKYENALTPNDKQMKEFTEGDIGMQSMEWK